MPGLVERGQQIAGIRITEEDLCIRRLAHFHHGFGGDPVRPIAAPREPHGVEGGIVGAFQQRREPNSSRSAKWPSDAKHCVELQFERTEIRPG